MLYSPPPQVRQACTHLCQWWYNTMSYYFIPPVNGLRDSIFQRQQPDLAHMRLEAASGWFSLFLLSDHTVTVAKIIPNKSRICYFRIHINKV